MSLASNTRRLLQQPEGAKESGSTRVEYHLLSWRELYDKSILTVDRHSSGAAEWVIQGSERLPYEVRVVSRPFQRLPQELCLAFDCLTIEVETVQDGIHIRSVRLPFHEVALEFSVLLSVFAREPLLPLGLRRLDNRPIIQSPFKEYQPRSDRSSTPSPLGIIAPDFIALVSGLAQAPEQLTDAIQASANFYHTGLTLVARDPSAAYVSLVSAIECLAGYHGRGRTFAFQDVPKFANVAPILDRMAETVEARPAIEELKAELLRSEHFLRQKFVSFMQEFVTEEFWKVPDELFKYHHVFPLISPQNFSSCLKAIYDARSSYLHGGEPFPGYVDFGMRATAPDGLMLQMLELKGKTKYVPSLAWFERLCHVAMVQFFRRSLAPGVADAEANRIAETQRILGEILALPANVQESLRRLVRWTAPFLGAAVMNPHAPNREWADSADTVQALRQAALVEGEGDDLDGQSWLKDREVGEIAGEFVFGAASNPFRGNELLLPRGLNWPRGDARAGAELQ